MVGIKLFVRLIVDGSAHRKRKPIPRDLLPSRALLPLALVKFFGRSKTTNVCTCLINQGPSAHVKRILLSAQLNPSQITNIMSDSVYEHTGGKSTIIASPA